MGLFNLLNSQTKYVDEDSQDMAQSIEANQSQEYFLDTDEAKTMGNIDYMRSSVKVKKSYPKTKTAILSGEVVEQISATDKATLSQNETPIATSEPAYQSGGTLEQNGQVSSKPRRPDSSLDPFLKMAQDLRKG
ncbi:MULTISPECIES: hypothetical protein [unclassified Moorena]|uniref:hypothetical protein n=1 Tax=unclassified Moorena TaxID=2683338 RepID=UPI0013C879A6|nr:MULTISPECIES: hypothetical protein [unclassified Moorena]NEO19933.1 hypothetical protein [Moorena sp. SIO4A5]NEP22247.1 hypothetical protein [Moorena sp. SIO3I6]NEQ55934.1 hypothetical protein [Moorena sp. SIO4A1]